MTAAVAFTPGGTPGVHVITSTLPPTSNTFTVCYFLRRRATTGTYSTSFSLEGAATTGHTISTDSSGSTLGYFQPDAAAPTISGDSFVDGQWYFVALVVRSTRATLYWKKLGAPTCKSAAANIGAASYTPTKLFAGAESDGFGFDGSMAGLRYWSGVALTQAELEAESEQIEPVRTGDIWAFWRMDRASDAEALTSEIGLSAGAQLGALDSNRVAQGDGPPIAETRAKDVLRRRNRIFTAALAGGGGGGGSPKTFYLLDAAASGSSHGSLQDGGTPPSALTTTTGWTGPSSGQPLYAVQAYGSQRPSAALGATAQPASAPSTNDCWRSEAMSVAIEAGPWTVSFGIISDSGFFPATGNLRVRIWKSPNADGSGATEITSGAVDTTSFTTLNSPDMTSVTTGTLPAVDLANEYLFVQVAIKFTSNATVGLFLRQDGTNSFVTTPNAGPLPVTGTAAAAARALTALGSGVVAFVGAGSPAIARPAASAAALERLLGSGSGAVPRASATASGMELLAGAGSATVSPASAAGAGAESFDGAGSAALSHATGSGAGDESMVGAGAASVARAGASGAGGETLSGAGNASLRSLTATSTGQLRYSGAGAASLAPMAAVGAGGILTAFEGVGAASLASLGASGAALASFLGAGGGALQRVSGAGAGVLTLAATGAPALARFGATSSGTYTPIPVSGSAVAAVAPLSASGVGPGVGIGGSGTAELSALAGGAAASQSLLATSAPELASLAASALGTYVHDLAGTGAPAVARLAAAAAGRQEVSGSGGGAFASLRAAGASTSVVVGAGTGALSPLACSGVALFQLVRVTRPATVEIVKDVYARLTITLDVMASVDITHAPAAEVQIMASDNYIVGATAKLTITVRVDGVLTDPTDLVVEVKPPGGPTVSYAWNTDAEVERTSQGAFTAEIDLAVAGVWDVYAKATGVGAAIDVNAKGAESCRLNVRKKPT